jgi:heme-degrading monooxygenase HmoA
MSVARVAIFDEPPRLHDDDDRRANTLRELLQSLPGFITGYDLREEPTGRLMSVTVWESEAALAAGERAVRDRPVSDQRGIRPSRVERWAFDARFEVAPDVRGGAAEAQYLLDRTRQFRSG